MNDFKGSTEIILVFELNFVPDICVSGQIEVAALRNIFKKLGEMVFLLHYAVDN